MTPRIGILGGTFDPVHNGHIALAEAAGKLCDLSEVMLLPSAFPPHKQNQQLTEYLHRSSMVNIAAQDNQLLYVSTLEQLLPSPSYTIDTLQYLKLHTVGETDLYFIIGADAFLDIRTWYKYKEVLKEAHFIVFSRKGFKNKKLLKLFRKLDYIKYGNKWHNDENGKSIFTSSATLPSVSSSAIRTLVAEKHSVDTLVPLGVSQYISEHGLYLT